MTKENTVEDQGSSFSKKLKTFAKVFRKAACIFDDIAVPLQALVPVIGPLLLCAAGYIIFSIEIYSSFTGLKKSLKKPLTDETRIGAVIAHLEQFLFSIFGLLATTALLVVTITLMIVAVKSLVLLAPIFSIAIPATMAVMEGIEWAESINVRACAKTPAEIEKTNRKLFFNTVFFGISLTVAALAALGIITGGIAPSIAVVGIIVCSISLKLFEMWDKKNGYVKCNAIRDTFLKLFCCGKEKPTYECTLTHTNTKIEKVLQNESIATSDQDCYNDNQNEPKRNNDDEKNTSKVSDPDDSGCFGGLLSKFNVSGLWLKPVECASRGTGEGFSRNFGR